MPRRHCKIQILRVYICCNLTIFVQIAPNSTNIKNAKVCDIERIDVCKTITLVIPDLSIDTRLMHRSTSIEPFYHPVGGRTDRLIINYRFILLTTDAVDRRSID